LSDVDGVELHVSPELESAPNQIRAAAETLREELDGLRNDLQPMLDHWQGQTKNMFEPYQEEWNAAAKNLFDPDPEIGHLGAVAQALQEIWDHYVETEQGNAQTWKH
jgi:WXG100 family type VII secretion target